MGFQVYSIASENTELACAIAPCLWLVGWAHKELWFSFFFCYNLDSDGTLVVYFWQRIIYWSSINLKQIFKNLQVIRKPLVFFKTIARKVLLGSFRYDSRMTHIGPRNRLHRFPFLCGHTWTRFVLSEWALFISLKLTVVVFLQFFLWPNFQN